MAAEQESFISGFLPNPIDEFKKIIDKELGDSFDSHEFILKFGHKFQNVHAKVVNHYDPSTNQPYREAHSQIALFLLRNRDELHITNAGKVRSPNIFGIVTENELWQKTAT